MPVFGTQGVREVPGSVRARNFAFVYYARRRVDAEIAVVHLIDYSVGDVGELGAAVVAPAFGVGAVGSMIAALMPLVPVALAHTPGVRRDVCVGR